jgi:hypothetical protein
MKSLLQFVSLLLVFFLGITWVMKADKLISPSNSYIQYYGRWDTTDSLHYKHSWPGNYIIIAFTGTKITVKMADNTSYYNVIIDNKDYPILHGDVEAEKDYLLTQGLENVHHVLCLSKRNFSFSHIPVFSGFILDDDGDLLPPPPRLKRKILFVGDSYTAAEGNEATETEIKWENTFPLTNIDKGFAPLIAKHFAAEYQTICKSGAGMVCDWKSDTSETIPKLFDRTLMIGNLPKYDFNSWVPDVIVICLGINDYNGLKDKTEDEVLDENSLIFRTGYHKFIRYIRNIYQEVKIVAVAAHVDWIQNNVEQVVDEEKDSGTKEIFYAKFDKFNSGYVANGHPTVETHKQIAGEIIKVIEEENIFVHEK